MAKEKQGQETGQEIAVSADVLRALGVDITNSEAVQKALADALKAHNEKEIARLKGNAEWAAYKKLVAAHTTEHYQYRVEEYKKLGLDSSKLKVS